MAIAIDIIEPCGFAFGDASLKRAGLDYLPRAMIVRHASWRAFREGRAGRLVLATSKAPRIYTEFDFHADDTLLFGRESAGVTPEIAAQAQGAVRIPMAPDMRSLNVAVSVGMILGEALRQTGLLPSPKDPLT